MGPKSRFGMGLNKSSAENLTTLYYNSSYGYTGISDLVSNSEIPRATVENWLSRQKVYTLHKPIKRRCRTRRVIVFCSDDQWQTDLFVMQKYNQHNKNINYILTVIGIFSKYA